MMLRLTPLRALRDALVVIKEGITSLSQYEIDPPQFCETVAPNSDWITKVGDHFYKLVLTR